MTIALPKSLTKNKSTKDSIISVLSEDWPLSAREVYLKMRRDYGHKQSYQSVYSAIRRLLLDDVLELRGRKYLLNQEWIKNLEKFSELTRKNYSQHEELLEVGAGSSVEKNAFVAGKEAAEKAFAQLRFNKQIQLALVFASSTYGNDYSDVIAGVKSVCGDAPLAGCSTMGEINGGHLCNSVTVALFGASEEVFSTKPVVLPLSQEHYDGSGFSGLLDSLEREVGFKTGYPDFALFFFPGFESEKNFRVVAPDFLREFASRFSTPFPLAGCLSGDDWGFRRTNQFCRSQVFSEAIVFVAIKTKLRFGVRRLHGYSPSSDRRFKIKVRNGTVAEMACITRNKTGEFKPALNVYSKETGMASADIRASLPKFVREIIAQNKCPPITRVSDGVHGYPGKVEDTSVWFDNAFQTGDVIQISHTTPNELVETTRKVIEETASIASIKKPAVALLFSCASIEVILQAHNIDEIMKIRKNGLQGMPIVGCYNGGEIGPVAVPQASGTVVAVLIGNELR